MDSADFIFIIHYGVRKEGTMSIILHPKLNDTWIQSLTLS